jgi:hypothetical protein
LHHQTIFVSKNMKKVFERLNQFGITLNMAKCEFGKTELDFLGFHITEKGLRPLNDKIKTIQQYPKPRTAEELRRFLGMLNFYTPHLPHAADVQTKLNEYINGCKKRDRTEIKVA